MKTPHSSALDGLITVTVVKAVNQLRPGSTPISLPDSEHNRALIRAGYFAIVQEEQDEPVALEEFLADELDDEDELALDDELGEEE